VIRTVAAVAGVVVFGLGVAPGAFADDAPYLEVYPTEVRPGAVFGTGVRGHCDTYSTVSSPGFQAPVDIGADPDSLWGTGSAVRTPGTYTASAVCDSRTLTAQFTVLPHQPPSWWLSPVQVQPGGQISAGSDTISGCPGGPTGPVTSPGFAAPLQFTEGGNFGRFSGSTTVTGTPGTYTATLVCANTPIPGTLEFTVLPG
jgi:hypothetical protein